MRAEFNVPASTLLNSFSILSCPKCLRSTTGKIDSASARPKTSVILALWRSRSIVTGRGCQTRIRSKSLSASSLVNSNALDPSLRARVAPTISVIGSGLTRPDKVLATTLLLKSRVKSLLSCPGMSNSTCASKLMCCGKAEADSRFDHTAFPMRYLPRESVNPFVANSQGESLLVLELVDRHRSVSKVGQPLVL